MRCHAGDPLRPEWRCIAVIAALGGALAAAQADDALERASPVRAVGVDGTILTITLAAGGTLRSHDLVGAHLLVDRGGPAVRVRLDAIERDPDDRRRDVAAADVIWLHAFSVEVADGAWQPLCDAGPDGRRQAIPVAGRFSPADGRLASSASGGFELACTAGAMGKCIRFGYHPWQSRAVPAPVPPRPAPGSRPAPSHLDLYNACLRLVRADYGGDGVGTTRNGMMIDLYDDRGIQTPDADPRMTFEAGWTADGAVCVNHPRVKESISLAEIAARWPRLAGLAGARCTEETARALGALLFNRSAP